MLPIMPNVKDLYQFSIEWQDLKALDERQTFAIPDCQHFHAVIARQNCFPGTK